MMRRNNLLLIFGAVLVKSAFSASPIAYNAVLALVVTEVVFAFSVGIVCIVFSFNLFRALKDTPSEEINSLPVGNLPPSKAAGTRTPAGSFSLSAAGHEPTVYQATAPINSPHYIEEDLELDYEGQLPGYQPPPESILDTFGNYLRWW